MEYVTYVVCTPYIYFAATGIQKDSRIEWHDFSLWTVQYVLRTFVLFFLALDPGLDWIGLDWTGPDETLRTQRLLIHGVQESFFRYIDN